MSEWYRRFRAWGDALHAELEADYGRGLGDLEAHVDIGYLFEIGADAETALTLAGMCFCDYIDHPPCATCKADEEGTERT